MQWTGQLDYEFEELMEDYAAIEPALERAVRFEDRLDRIERVLNLRTGDDNA